MCLCVMMIGSRESTTRCYYCYQLANQSNVRMCILDTFLLGSNSIGLRILSARPTEKKTNGASFFLVSAPGRVNTFAVAWRMTAQTYSDRGTRLCSIARYYSRRGARFQSVNRKGATRPNGEGGYRSSG